MRSLSFLIFIFFLQLAVYCQSPHEGTLQYDCSSCHQASDWKVIPENMEFNHSQTGFALAGQHSSVSCRSCHTQLKFAGTPQNCSSCHKDIHMNTVGFDCSRCHTPNSWTVKDYNNLHQKTRFPLTGAHIRSDCASCHQRYPSLIFDVKGIRCYDCHAQNYVNTAKPNHAAAGFSTECQDCHAVNSDRWSASNFSHDFFPLTGGHQIADCFSCHVSGNYSNISRQCYSCHKKDYDRTTDPNHLQAQFSTDCSQCHSITKWGDGVFDHSRGNFPLTGSHINVDCKSCHVTGYAGTSAQCFSCHQDNYNSAPNHAALSYPQDCKMCHNTVAWNQTTFDHNTTNFPLTGSHVNVNCSSCHKSGFSGTPDQCYSCHQENYNSAPNHTAQNYPQDCKMCHNTTAWNQTSFDHNTTQFPLTGVHLTTQCSSCHTSGFAGTPKECVSCHQQNYNNAANPSHTALAIPVTCQDCHSVNPNWEPALFPIHSNYYVIAGAHLQITSCAPCHNGNYNSTPNTCFGCHANDYNNTTNPAHSAAGFPTECINCHTQTAWKPSTFNHDGQYFPIYSGKHLGRWNLCSDCHTVPTNFSLFSCIDCHEHNKLDTDSHHQGVSGYVYASAQCYACHPTGSSDGAFDHNISGFPLTGAHLTLNCLQCHQNGYSGTPVTCISCHQTNYSSASNPNHKALGISTECSGCHTTNPGWKPALFPQHDQYFILTGAHLQIFQNCSACHNGNYNTTSTECAGCHQTDYNNTQNPNHVAAGISHSCSSCHNSTAWIPSTFNHASTGFELTGQHLLLQCSSCHQGTTGGLTNTCVSCHQTDYNNAPNHTAQNYPVECGMCHNASAWNQTNFNHANTVFPLTGAHLNVNCTNCHQTGFTGTTTVCVNCHQAAYNNSVNPSHTALQLSTDCKTCHTTNPDWQPALFPVHANFYPLLGAHSLIQNCSSCHNGNYNSTPNTCYGCHQNDYNATTNPAHATAGFPHECQSCHTLNGWTPSTFNHDGQYFPIYTGEHAGRWTLCSTCHTNPADFTVFSCITCHEHNQTEMNQQHTGVIGYVYESGACYNCHPDGNTRPVLPKSRENKNK